MTKVIRRSTPEEIAEYKSFLFTTPEWEAEVKTAFTIVYSDCLPVYFHQKPNGKYWVLIDRSEFETDSIVQLERLVRNFLEKEEMI